MLAKRTSPSLAPSFEDLTRAQGPAPRWSGSRFSGEQSESRSMPPLAARVLAVPDVGSPSDNGASPRERFGPPAARNPGRIESPRGCGIFILANPAGLHGRRAPTIALWCAVGTVRNRPTRQLAQEPRSVQRRPIMSAMGPIGPPASAWARKSMAARPGAGFAGRPKLKEGWGCRDPALRASRSTAWSSANVTTAGPKPAGNNGAFVVVASSQRILLAVLIL